MKELRKILADVENSVKKGITTGSLDGGTGSNTLTSAQNLDPVIPSIANRNTEFYDRVAKVDGHGAGVTFNLRKSLFTGATNPRNMVYTDGGLPQQRTSQYYTQYKGYYAVGLDGSVTGLAQAIGESVLDLYATEVEATTRAVIQGIDWLSFWGSETTLNDVGLKQPTGLNEYITTNVIDAGGAVISKALIDSATTRIREYGGTATHMFTSYRVQGDMNNLFNDTSRVIVNQDGRNDITLGNIVPKVQTVAGMLEVVGDFFINPGNTYPVSNGSSSSPLGATTSTVFIVNMNYIKLSRLTPPTFEELGRVADKREFYVKSYYNMELTAEPWMAKIINVKDNTIA